MAEISVQPGLDDHHDDLDFTFEDGGNIGANDEFDFDLDDADGAQVNDDLHLMQEGGSIAEKHNTVDDGNMPTGAIRIEEATAGGDVVQATTPAELDEITYEDGDDSPVKDQRAQVMLATNLEHEEVASYQADEIPVEIDYDEDDIDLAESENEDETASHDHDSGADVLRVASQSGTDQLPNGFALNDASATGVSSGQRDAVPDLAAFQDSSGLADQDVAGAAHVEQQDHGTDLSGGLVYDFEMDFVTETVPEVTVSWGDEVCPLFRTAENDDPDSFYLEDMEAMNYPLSQFLSAIRKKIASWVNDGDEIHIRVEELSLEFAETTTEALLGQITFNHLVALHDRLLKNDDATASGTLRLTLTTRPNCTLRLRDLVQGANDGKGLSMLRMQPVSNDSSPESEYNDETEGVSPLEEEHHEYMSQQPSPTDDPTSGIHDAGIVVDEEVAQPAQQEHTASVGRRHSHVDDDATGAGDTAESGTGHDDLFDYDEPIPEQNDNFGAIEHGLEEDLELLEDTMTTPLAAETANISETNQDQADLDVGEEPIDDFLTSNHRLDLTAQSLGITSGMDTIGQEEVEFDAEVTSLGEAASNVRHETDEQEETGLYEHGSAEEIAQPEDDEYLDFGDEGTGLPDQDGDVEHDDLVSNLQPPHADDTTGPHEADSHQTSATTTITGDEIDYEDSAPLVSNAEDSNPPLTLDESNDAQGGLDEIDWDDEDKMNGPNTITSTPSSVTGKRGRELDDVDDELVEDGHDPKRHRT